MLRYNPLVLFYNYAIIKMFISNMNINMFYEIDLFVQFGQQIILFYTLLNISRIF